MRPIAESIAAESTPFNRLGAAQLIKHALGLTKAYSATGFELLYLWFDSPSEEADLHRQEVARFTEMIRGGITFTSQTYQDLFATIRDLPEPIPGYHAYLQDRYFKTRP